MGNLSGAELRRIERQYADGIKSATVVEIFQAKGHRFSEATLRKYVQLGLLPKSRRVGVRGRHRGSSGLYPVGIVRLVNGIKVALDKGATLEEVRFGNVGLTSELEVLRDKTREVIGRFEESIAQLNDAKHRGQLKRLVERERRAVSQRLHGLERLVSLIGGSHAT
jgi:hypothetical protein